MSDALLYQYFIFGVILYGYVAYIDVTKNNVRIGPVHHIFRIVAWAIAWPVLFWQHLPED